MTGLDVHDGRATEARSRHPTLYAIAEITLLCALGVLLYALVKLA
jgi:hypothetical protein